MSPGGTEFMAQPDDTEPLRASELHSSLGERLGAQAGEAFMGGVRSIYRIGEYADAEGNGPSPLSTEAELYNPGLGERMQQMRDAIPSVPIADAQARVKQEGLEKHIKLPDQTDIKQPVLDLMIEHAHERREYEAAVDRGPQGFFPSALGFITEMGVGMIDPVNAAAFAIPVIGEARMGVMMAGAGESIARRAGVRALAGGAQGAVGSTALVPGDWWLHSKDGQDYTMADALHSIIMGAGMGAGFHAGFGAISDVRARGRGEPLHGSPEDLVTRGLAGDRRAVEQNIPDDISVDDVPGVSVGNDEPPVPAGHTRLYRGEAVSGDRFRNEENGGYYTTDKSMASDFGSLRYVDLPGDAAAFFKMPGMEGGIHNLPNYEAGPGRVNWRARSMPLGPEGRQMPVHPAEILADLPPAVREDAVRAAIADVLADRPVRVGELLQVSADHDPRIAESVHGADIALERGVMETAGRHEGGSRVRDEASQIPGRAVSDDGSGTPPGGRATEAGGPEGQPPGQSEQPAPGARTRAGGRPDSTPSEQAAAFRGLADRRDPEAQTEAVESRAADREPEPASIDPEKAPSAAEKAAQEAEQLLKDIEPSLTEAERARFQEALDAVESDRALQETMVRDGVACLLAAIE